VATLVFTVAMPMGASKVPTTSPASSGASRNADRAGRGPPNSCHTLVTSDGTTRIAAAFETGM
jgi:hypothetical protein